MILFFHFLCLLAQYFISNVSKSLSKNKVVSKDNVYRNNLVENNERSFKKSVYENGTLKFFPPVYVQRYETVALVLEEVAVKFNVRKVVDFGCSELGFFMYLKSIEQITEILEVDIDEEKLERNSYKAAPLTTDYLMKRCAKPLDVYILAGNMADYDDILAGTDAVIGIEVIEHLTEEILNKIPYNVFHQIKPRIAIFTTPNAEFNSLFPNFTDLRHSDHKFEWTRKEFYSWTQEIIHQYPEYSVRFYGIGAGPEGTENLGCCTQMAVFQRFDDTEIFDSAREKLDGLHNYKLVNHYKYPVFQDLRSIEEKIIHEIQYQVSHIMKLPDFYNFEENECEIPLSLLKEYVNEYCSSEEELRSILEKNAFKLKVKDGEHYVLWSEAVLSDDNSFEDYEAWSEDGDSSREKIIFEESWDLDDTFPPNEEAHNFLSARSVEGLKLHVDNDLLQSQVENISTTKEVTKSAPESYNELFTPLHIGDYTWDEKAKECTLKSSVPQNPTCNELVKLSTTPEFKQNTISSYMGTSQQEFRLELNKSLDCHR